MAAASFDDFADGCDARFGSGKLGVRATTDSFADAAVGDEATETGGELLDGVCDEAIHPMRDPIIKLTAAAARMTRAPKTSVQDS